MQNLTDNLNIYNKLSPDQICTTLIKRNIKWDNHCLDLYILDNEENRKILENYQYKRGSVNYVLFTFEGVNYIELPFLYWDYKKDTETFKKINKLK